ncbi:hypothetical protein CURE108131_25475 [Cupriavidus respiraculi]|uniref:Uncharacterized protein n=1 Tax=Cupriavidus respiraculi TaxID=195930 RepID=A0ABM8XVM7_9BURK|nr:hypothetical protein LMG21510_05092 [Cupriavidus respiraculi]
MHGDEQDMVVVGQAQQAHAQQRPALQVEGGLRLGIDQRLDETVAGSGVRGGQVGYGDGEGRRRMDALHGGLALLVEGRAQAFVAGDQRVEGLAQRRVVQRAAQSHGARNVVQAGVRVHLPQEPQALLRVGQRSLGLAPRRDGQVPKVHAAGAQLFDETLLRFRLEAGEALGKAQFIHAHTSVSRLSIQDSMSSQAFASCCWLAAPCVRPVASSMLVAMAARSADSK